MLEKCNYKRMFSENAKFYKVNLNCHTNISNGQYTPEEIKELYKAHGYSAVAFSDSGKMLPHEELNDKDFIALSALEFTVTEESGKKVSLNAIALSPDAKAPAVPKDEPMSEDEIRKTIKNFKDSGFFVTCNHPRKSLVSCKKGSAYEDVDAIEILNYSSLVSGINEYNENYYEDVLKSGILPHCIATDGNTNNLPVGYRGCDSLGAYVVIVAKELSYEAIADALKEGRFYSSEGPEIYDLWFRSEVLYIRCSPCDKVIFESGTRREVFFAENGNLLDGKGMCFWVMPEHEYVRVTIVDKNGKKAFTNAYASNDIFYTYEKVGDLK